MLTRDQILSTTQLEKVKVELPQCKGYVYVSEMTGEQRDEFDRSLFVNGALEMKGSKFRLIAMTVVDESGKKIFSKDDVSAIAKLPESVIRKLASKAQFLNGMTEKAIKEAEGN